MKVYVEQAEYVASHGKEAKGKGSWVFAKERNDNVDNMYFAQYDTFKRCAKAAAEHFGVDTVWAQP